MRTAAVLTALLLTITACGTNKSAEAFRKACDLASQAADHAAAGDEDQAGVVMTRASYAASEAEDHADGALYEAASNLSATLTVDAALKSFDDPSIARICNSITDTES